MPIKDEAAMNASLDNDYGATKGPNAPASHQLALFVGDPQVDLIDGGGYEIDSTNCPGYARTTVSNNATWAPSEFGMKQTVDGIELPAPTDEWIDEPTHWALIASGEVIWDTGPFTEPMQITGASTEGIVVRPVVFYSDAVVEED
jgi:hypothetical protein